MDRKEYTEKLKQGVYKITFTKTDGSTRELVGTLKQDLLPPPVEVDPDAPPKKERAINESVVAVYDLEAQGFRSFRIDSVTAFEATEYVRA